MDKEQIAIERLKTAAMMSEKLYKQPLVITTSGGKDSGVVVELARRAGIPFEVQHNHTTADAPETVRFVRQELARLESEGIKCTINYPYYKGRRVTMWTLIPQKLMPPTRIVRYCCDVLKEQGGKGRFVVTGVRWAESAKRKNTRGIYEAIGKTAKQGIVLNNDNDERRQLFESCQLKAKRVCNPIIDWTDDDIWDYTIAEHIHINSLYLCGFSRVGCVGCPLAGKNRYREFSYWPKYEKLYLNAFAKMIVERKQKGKSCQWETAEDVMHWWMEDGVLPGQMTLQDFEEDA